MLQSLVVGGGTLGAAPAQVAAPLDPASPVVAIHVSEHTAALENVAATAPTPTGPDTTGKEWWIHSWRYFVAHQSLEEALQSDGTPYVEVSDADIAAGELLTADGLPRYPIVISLAAEAIANNEVQPLRDYVDAGGFLMAGSSSFTRNPNGTTRGNFALSDEMGLDMTTNTLSNWAVERVLLEGWRARSHRAHPGWIGPMGRKALVRHHGMEQRRSLGVACHERWCAGSGNGQRRCGARHEDLRERALHLRRRTPAAPGRHRVQLVDVRLRHLPQRDRVGLRVGGDADRQGEPLAVPLRRGRHGSSRLRELRRHHRRDRGLCSVRTQSRDEGRLLLHDRHGANRIARQPAQ